MLNIRVNDSKYNQEVKTKIASRGLVLSNNKVAILYSKKYNAYITPGGGVEENETLKQTCIREVQEETGLLVEPIEKIAVLDSNYPRVRIVHNYYICDLIKEECKTKRTIHEKDQDLELKWVSLEELIVLYTTHSNHEKYNTWMQRESIVIQELRKYLK